MLRTVNYCSSQKRISSVKIYGKKLQTGLVCNTTDKYGLTKIFG